MKKLFFRIRYKLSVVKNNGRYMVGVYDKKEGKQAVLCERYLSKKGVEDRIKEIYKNGCW